MEAVGTSEEMSTVKALYSLSDDYIITTPPIAVQPTESMGSFIFRNLKKHADKIAQIDAKSGQKDTFEELLSRSIRTALHMSAKQIKREDVVTLCTRNHLNAAVPYIATQFLGAKIANVDPSFSAKEMCHLLSTVRPRMIFATPESVALLEQVLEEIWLDSEIVVFGSSNKHSQFSDFLETHPDEDKFEPVHVENLKDTACIYFSSGTTGLPKGICISHYCFVGQMVNTSWLHSADAEYQESVAKRASLPLTHLGYTSFYWVSAGGMLMTSLNTGYCRLICETFDAVEIWNWFQKYKPTAVMLTPVQAIEMLAHRRKDVDVRSILVMSVMGSSISKEYLLKLKETFPDTMIAAGYGQTEICGPLSLFSPGNKHHRELREKPEKIESVGLPVYGNLYKIVDTETGKHLGPNQPGELLVKSAFIMNGYHDVDSSDTFDEHGWLKTGDIVYYDEDFCFYVVDRIKEAFKYQGWFIAPTALEHELSHHPAVKFAVVIGVPRDDGHHPMGLVVVNDGHHVTEEEIEKFVEERVPERQRLRAGVKFIKEVPRTVTGKVLRKKLRELVLEGKI